RGHDYRKEARSLADVAAWSDGQVNTTGGGVPERAPYASVTEQLFSVVSASALKGRAFASGEDLENGPRVAILGYGLWSRRYAADPGIIGRTIQIDGAAYEVVGVMPADFVLPTDFQNPAPSALW